MNILITGGAGFIGSHIVDFLLSKNHNITVIDNLVTGKIENISHNLNNPNFTFIEKDIFDLEDILPHFKNIDAICHQAAWGSVPKSIKQPLDYNRNNITGFINMLECARINNIKRVVYASSSSVYGDNKDLIKKEQNVGTVLSPYALTKYIDELFANLYFRLYNVETIGLRYFNIFGNRQNPEGDYAAVIPKFIKIISNNQSPIINGDGTISRDFTYVSNAVQANHLAIMTKNEKAFGRAFNVGCGDSITINELVENVNMLLNKNISPTYGPSRQGDILYSKADISEIQNILEYSPLINFKEGLNKLINNG